MRDLKIAVVLVGFVMLLGFSIVLSMAPEDLRSEIDTLNVDEVIVYGEVFFNEHDECKTWIHSDVVDARLYVVVNTEGDDCETEVMTQRLASDELEEFTGYDKSSMRFGYSTLIYTGVEIEGIEPMPDPEFVFRTCKITKSTDDEDCMVYMLIP